MQLTTDGLQRLFNNAVPGLAEARTFATGLSPDKQVVRADAALVRRAHARGLLVTPYTFRASAVGTFADVGAEMRDALSQGVDGVSISCSDGKLLKSAIDATVRATRNGPLAGMKFEFYNAARPAAAAGDAKRV